jgi:hypothetical protein
LKRRRTVQGTTYLQVLHCSPSIVSNCDGQK